ncbi:MAG: large repetitive protein [Pseudomonadota bacterium]|nr:large repetitive protein [Pseudomonadota bacterium]
MKHQVLKLFFFAAIIPFSIFLQSCSSSDVGGNGDATKPVVTLSGIVDASTADDEIIGEATIQWTTDDPNRSTVDIYLSTDSGATYPATPLANDVPDTGEYSFDTNDIDDCRNCRVRIIARDVVGNVSDPVESTQDFVINNVPQVLGSALYIDVPSTFGAEGVGPGDTIVVPFDKDVEVRTGIASDIFFLPVLGDNIGSYATLRKGAHANELVITMDNVVPFNGHLHVSNDFNPARQGRTASSGLNVYDNLPDGVLYARDTGRTAAFVAGGIDITAGFYDTGIIINTYDTNGYPDYAGFITGDLNNDGYLDMIQLSNGGVATDSGTGFRVRLNSGSYHGLYTISSEFCFPVNGDCPYAYSGAMVLGDVDGDQDLDFIQGSNGHTGSGNDGIRIWLNNGAGVFSDSLSALCSLDINGNCDYSYSIALADMNGDTHLDIVEGTYRSATRIWLNDGTGAYTDSGLKVSLCSYDDPITTGCDYYTAASSLTLGDVNGDGYMDIVEGIANEAVTNQLWLNSVSGTFTNAGQSLSYCEYTDTVANVCNYYTNTRAVVLADVDGDADLDLFVAGRAYDVSNSRANRLWLNNGGSQGGTAGQFVDSGRSFGNYEVGAITVADMDADDDVDLVQASNNGTRVWRNNGVGIFADSGQLLGGYAELVSVGDLDHDSDLDVISVYGGARLLLNSLSAPEQYFMDSEQTLPESDTASIALGDVDGDDDLDQIYGSSGQGSRVYINNRNNIAINQGVFTDSGQALCSESLGGATGGGTCASTHSVVLIDVDGDDDLDIVEGLSYAGIRIWLNNGGDQAGIEGQFTDSGQQLGCLYDDPDTAIVCDWGYYDIPSLVLVDVDSDGDKDMLASENGYGIQVWKNDGQGNFSEYLTQFGATDAFSILLGNLDNDSALELIVGSYFGNQIQVWDNDGAGAFSQINMISSSTNVGTMVLGDVDNDTKLDLIVGGDNANGSQVWKGDGAGGFSTLGLEFGLGYATAVTLGDVDADHDLDLVVGYWGQANELWLNNGNGGFGTGSAQTLCRTNDPSTTACLSNTQSVVMGDVDNDDDLDLVQSGSVANEVWLNDI